MSHLEIRQATLQAIDAISCLYDDVNDYMASTINYNLPTWKKGKYPNKATAEQVVLLKTLFLACLHDEIVGAAILNHEQYDGY